MASMNTIKTLRKQAGITQQALAIAAGTSQSTIAAYEAGVKSPTLRTVNHLAKSVGMEMVETFVPEMTREDRRSLAFHRELTDALRKSPETILDHAKNNLSKLSTIHPYANTLFQNWRTWLDQPIESLIENMLAPSPLAREMRHVSPFSGLLAPADRARILRQFREAEKS